MASKLIAEDLEKKRRGEACGKKKSNFLLLLHNSSMFYKDYSITILE